MKRPGSNIQPAPLGVKTAALAACEENVDFFDGPPSAFAPGDAADGRPAGVNDGESTLSAFLALWVSICQLCSLIK